jgi:hypothetical protein
MAYSHPVAVTLSVLWWGHYFGWFGAGLGALLGLLTERAPASLSQEADSAGEPPNGAARPALPSDYGDYFRGANRASEDIRVGATFAPLGVPGR